MEHENNGQLSPEGQRDYEVFLRSIPDYFQNADFMSAVSAKIANAGTTQIDHEKMNKRGEALVRKWSEETTIEDWAVPDDPS
jgi:hypothetical protein